VILYVHTQLTPGLFAKRMKQGEHMKVKCTGGLAPGTDSIAEGLDTVPENDS